MKLTPWNQMNSRELNRRIFAGLICLAVFYSGLAFAAEVNPADTAERIDKLGATGILAFGFLLTCGALVYLIRLQYGKHMEVLERNATVMTQLMEVIRECKHNHKGG